MKDSIEVKWDSHERRQLLENLNVDGKVLGVNLNR